MVFDSQVDVLVFLLGKRREKRREKRFGMEKKGRRVGKRLYLYCQMGTEEGVNCSETGSTWPLPSAYSH